MTKVKICGLMEPLHIQSAQAADAVGFVFAPSRRQVTIDEAAKLAGLVPGSAEKIGVFVNASLDEIERAVEQVPLTMVQLHGDEPASLVRSIPVPVIQAFAIRSAEDVEKMNSSVADYVLVDAPGTDFRGGSGRVFDWTLLEGSRIPSGRLVLAGGLNARNVQAAIRQVQPFMVDVSSGVETAGRKDSAKIKQFIRQARRA